MELKFNTVEEVLEFADTLRRHAVTEPGVVRPGSIDPAAFVEHLGRIAGRADKIAAIKLYRAVTGQGLRESKEAVERAPEFQRRLQVDTWDYGCGDPDCGCGPSFEEPDCRKEDTPF